MTTLERITYESLEPGTYSLFLPRMFNIISTSQFPGERRTDNLPLRSRVGGGEHPIRGIHSGVYEGKDATPEREYPDTKEWRAGEDTLFKAGQGPLLSSGPPERDTSESPERIAAEEKIPQGIKALEEVLTETYGTSTCVSSVREVPFTRKEVKAVDIIQDGYLSTLWIFKAEPQKTARELAIYSVAYDQGVATAKPLLFDPSEESYPYDIAILGGVVEHAGDAYESVFERLALAPDQLFSTAEHVGRLMAQYHAVLTNAADTLAQYGVHVKRADPTKELQERVLAVTGEIPRLEEVCTKLHESQSGPQVMSHGDIHLKNVLARNKDYSVDLKHFGVIDWDSVQYDSPYNDLWDFWVHHTRKANEVTSEYPYTFEDFSRAYFNEADRIGLDVYPDSWESLVHEILWNVYEVADPQRQSMDFRKATFHIERVQDATSRLSEYDPSLAGALKEGTDSLRYVALGSSN